jgi:hypothetical protein
VDRLVPAWTDAVIADIASGNVDAADIFFVVAVILAVLAALVSVPRRTNTASVLLVWAPVLGWLALASTAFALLLL